jgi:hypothetical protein
MSDFICDECGQTFTQNVNLQYHISHGSCKVREHACNSCGKQFAAKSSMYRHMRNSCTVKKQNDAEKESILDRLVKMENDMENLKTQNKQLMEENKKLKIIKPSKTSKTTINNKIGTLNNTKNINKGVFINNLTLVGYGKEDFTKLDRAELLKILQHGYNSTIKLTEAVHFNPKYPEYHNVYISNMKDKYAMMFDGVDWKLTMKEDLINKIYDDKKNYIEENLEDFLDSLSESRKNALNRWLEAEDDDEKISKIKNEIKLLLYNKRNLIIDKQKDIILASKSPDNDTIDIDDEVPNVMVKRKTLKSKKLPKDS